MVEGNVNWQQIRNFYPAQWLIIEALEAHSSPDHHRSLDQLVVVETAPDGAGALLRYRQLHREYPQREFYFVHTSRETLDIREYFWMGIRNNHAAVATK